VQFGEVKNEKHKQYHTDVHCRTHQHPSKKQIVAPEDADLRKVNIFIRANRHRVKVILNHNRVSGVFLERLVYPAVKFYEITLRLHLEPNFKMLVCHICPVFPSQLNIVIDFKSILFQIMSDVRVINHDLGSIPV